MVNEIQELQCWVDNGGRFWVDAVDADLLSNMMGRFGANTARARCQCLVATTQRSGFGLTVNGPDIPGFYLATLPLIQTVVIPLAPFLPFIKITTQATLTYYPYYCGVTRTDIGMTVALVLDLVFMKEVAPFFVRSLCTGCASEL